MPLISVLLLLYCRVRLPWTDAFSAVPIICFGFQVCTSLAICNHKIFLFTGKQLQLYTVDVKVCFKHLEANKLYLKICGGLSARNNIIF